MAFAAAISSTGSCEGGAVQRDGQPGLERDRDGFGLDRDGGIPVGDAHDRLDDLHRGAEQLEVLGLVGRAEHVGVGRIRLLGGRPVRQPALGEPLAHLGAAAQLLHERGVEPRLVDAQMLVREQAVAVEALDVVSLVGRAVAPDVDAVLGHRADEQRAGDGATERSRVEVALARSLDVEGTALERCEALACERVAAVDDDGILGAVELRAIRDAGDVRLVGLAEVGSEGVGDRAALAHPGDRAAGIEPAGEGDADALADRQRAENDAERDRADAHVLPSR